MQTPAGKEIWCQLSSRPHWEARREECQGQSEMVLYGESRPGGRAVRIPAAEQCPRVGRPRARGLPRPAKTGARSRLSPPAARSGSAPEPACPPPLRRVSASSCNRRGNPRSGPRGGQQEVTCIRAAQLVPLSLTSEIMHFLKDAKNPPCAWSKGNT